MNHAQNAAEKIGKLSRSNPLNNYFDKDSINYNAAVEIILNHAIEPATAGLHEANKVLAAEVKRLAEYNAKQAGTDYISKLEQQLADSESHRARAVEALELAKDLCEAFAPKSHTMDAIDAALSNQPPIKTVGDDKANISKGMLLALDILKTHYWADNCDGGKSICLKIKAAAEKLLEEKK